MLLVVSQENEGTNNQQLATNNQQPATNNQQPATLTRRARAKLSVRHRVANVPLRCGASHR
jgi:hypothetical protein